MVYLDDVAYWVREWQATREPISAAIARTIAGYWGESGILTAFARGLVVDRDELAEEVESMIVYAKSSDMFTPTMPELYALKAWIARQ